MDTLNQENIDWLNTTIDTTEPKNTELSEDKKPKFVKIYANKGRRSVWYKATPSPTSNGGEVYVEATPAEIRKWNLN